MGASAAKVSRVRHAADVPEYNTWAQMIQRCTNPNCKLFPHYGARGIAVCHRWRASFDAFIADMGLRPSSTHSIDRIDVNGNYEPGNCRWATRTEQARNKRSNRHLTIGDRTMLVVEWSAVSGVRNNVISARLSMGWDPTRAVFTPVRTKGSRQ